MYISIDIAKAYDSVNRGKLSKHLEIKVKK